MLFVLLMSLNLCTKWLWGLRMVRDCMLLLVDRTTVVQSHSTSSCSSTETLQEIEWTCKENSAKLFIYWILGRSAIVLNNFFSFWMAWQCLPEMKWNGTECRANHRLWRSSTAMRISLLTFTAYTQDSAFTKQLKKSIKSYSFLSF